jgi:hypothetical protein
MVEQQPSKLNTRVRFPSPAPVFPLSRWKPRPSRFAIKNESISDLGSFFSLDELLLARDEEAHDLGTWSA